MARRRSKDHDLAPGFRRINGVVYYQPTTHDERKARTIRARLDAIPKDAPVVYFVRATAGPVKIGFCASRGGLKARIASLQTGSAVRLRLLGAVAGTLAEEQRAHHLLAAHRARGEWFGPADEVTSFVARTLDLGRVPVNVKELGIVKIRPFQA